MKKISICIPVLNEEENIKNIYNNITNLFKNTVSNYDYEIIDEQVIQNHKEKILLSEKIDKLSKQINSEQSELEDLKNKLKDLK